jgi:hypothetical protein
MALALGKLTTGTPKFRGSGFVGMHVKPITAQEKFNFPRANAILARAQALLWVRDCNKLGNHRHMRHATVVANQDIAYVINAEARHVVVAEREITSPRHAEAPRGPRHVMTK